ncbi:hypothetical protein FACS1894137_01030 [Spirochaetia bacterium]|nr:hypothetical protein FACS1894137_01030 [Spirochaetia bacterium]
MKKIHIIWLFCLIPAFSFAQAGGGANMVLVEWGSFQMGNDNGEKEEIPVHSVTVRSFRINKYEVSQQEWISLMENNPSNFKGNSLPVENVTWYEAVEYCNALSLKEGLSPAYRIQGNATVCDFNANGYRLPTEAEWEYAAKGGKKDYLALTYSGGENPADLAWYHANSGGRTHTVGTKTPNSLGLYDMSGNVWEWCWDWYGSYGKGEQIDPKGHKTGVTRVRRGGGWFFGAEYLRSTVRGQFPPSNRSGYLGFRVCQSVVAK